MTSGLAVSVIVPVYNALPYLGEMLDSLAAQDLAPSLYNVITVDDGSTDGCSEVLDEYARRYAHFAVIHQANSRRPGRPRNAGLRRASGDFVFFADADDVLAPACLRRLLDFAHEHHSDIVIPRLTSLGGRGFPTSVYEKTVVEADLVTAFKTLFPQKLFRHQMLTDHDIWFPEGVRLDDGMFNTLAYLHARRISIVSDADYYFLREHRDGQHLSRTPRDPVTYSSSVAAIGRVVRQHLGTTATADQILLDLYRRKCLNVYDPRFLCQYDDRGQDDWMSAHQSFATEFVTEEMERRLESPFRERAHFIRLGDKASLLASSRREHDPVVSAMISDARWIKAGLELVVDAAIEGRITLPRQLICEIRRRDGEGGSAFPLVRRAPEPPPYGRTAQYDGVFSMHSTRALLPGTYDVHVVSLSGKERSSCRVQWRQGVRVPAYRGGMGIHPTKSGNVSLKKTERGTAWDTPAGMKLRAAVSRLARTVAGRR
jgi:glycosyltransferase involved in cell wall biosynthesis